MSQIISDDSQTNAARQVGISARSTEPTAETLAALPTLLILVPCLIAGIWLLISR